jgi:hypothetical protein
MSGHQGEFWHAGIVAKLLALRELGRALAGASTAWVVVDQDANEPGVIRYPTIANVGLATAEWRISSSDSRVTDVPLAAREPWKAQDLEPRWGERPAATGAVAVGLGAMRDALLDEAGSADLTTQMIGATRALLRRRGLDGDAAWFRATTLAQTSLFAEVVERIKGDPGRCVAAYNSAVSRHAGAGVAPLNAGRGEMPLWRVRRGLARGRVLADALYEIPLEQLAPRALLMTGLLRHAGCDIFIHGLGGGKYDVIAEDWLREWLGWSLAPAVVATGTLLARLTDEPPPSPEMLARVRWRLQHARHTPAALGDAWAQQRKDDLVAEIRALKARGAAPYGAYAALQALLSRARIDHAGTLANLTREASDLAARAAASKVALDRTWAFPLHDAAALGEFARAVERLAFGAKG